mmetsp:Transcript_79967/g.216421  ORF Transcript_79967/g.216421 Transcript_79967/m.216421 type:complete len:272 (+) Transcript_79967:133-948(+)
MKDLTAFSLNIIRATTECAQELGWSGETIEGDDKVQPFHNENVCAVEILSMFSKVASIFGDSFNMAFVCFNSNQACAQTTVSIATYLLDASKDLASADQFCQRIGADPPFYSKVDAPYGGMECWAVIWNAITKVLKAAKFTDVAINVCAPSVPTVPEPEPVPEPIPKGTTAAAEPAPEPVAGAAAAEPAAQPTLGAAASSWSNLGQPQPFKALGDDMGASASSAVERRLADALSGIGPLVDEDARRNVFEAFIGEAADSPHEAKGDSPMMV